MEWRAGSIVEVRAGEKGKCVGGVQGPFYHL